MADTHHAHDDQYTDQKAIQTQFHTRNLTEPEKEEFEAYLSKRLERLETRMAKHYPDGDTVRLEVHFEKHDKHTAFELRANLYLPRKHGAIAAKEVKHTIKEPIDKVVDILDREVNQHFEKLMRK